LVLDNVGGGRWQQFEVAGQGEMVGGEGEVRQSVDADLFTGSQFENGINLKMKLNINICLIESFSFSENLFNKTAEMTDCTIMKKLP